MRRRLTVGGAAVLSVVVLCSYLASPPVSASTGHVGGHASTWTTKLLEPGLIGFLDVSCPTAQVCTAVGAEGVAAIYRTVNGGTTPGSFSIVNPSVEDAPRAWRPGAVALRARRLVRASQVPLRTGTL